MGIGRINLIPKSVQRARTQRRRLRGWTAAIVASASTALAAGGVEWHGRSELEAARERGAVTQQSLDAVRVKVGALEFEVDQTRRHVERATALRAKRSWSGLFVLLERTLPESCRLVSMATDPSTPPAGDAKKPPVTTGSTPGDKPDVIQIDAPRKLRLMGYAPDASLPYTFVTALKEADVFAHVSLERSQREETPTGASFLFEIVCEW